MTATFLHRLWRDSEGVSLIEAALILPVVMLLTIGFIDLTGAFAFQMRLMQAAHTATDYVIASRDSVPLDSDIITRVSSVTGLPASSFAIARRLECNGVPASPGATTCPNTSDDAVTYMAVSVTGTYQPVAPVPVASAMLTSTTLQQSASVRLP